MIAEYIRDLCRVCEERSDDYICIYDRVVPENTPFFCIINDVCQLDIAVDDGLPEYICKECFMKISEFMIFKRRSHEAKVNFLSMKLSLSEDPGARDAALDKEAVVASRVIVKEAFSGQASSGDGFTCATYLCTAIEMTSEGITLDVAQPGDIIEEVITMPFVVDYEEIVTDENFSLNGGGVAEEEETLALAALEKEKQDGESASPRRRRKHGRGGQQEETGAQSGGVMLQEVFETTVKKRKCEEEDDEETAHDQRPRRSFIAQAYYHYLLEKKKSESTKKKEEAREGSSSDADMCTIEGDQGAAAGPCVNSMVTGYNSGDEACGGSPIEAVQAAEPRSLKNAGVQPLEADLPEEGAETAHEEAEGKVEVAAQGTVESSSALANGGVVEGSVVCKQVGEAMCYKKKMLARIGKKAHLASSGWCREEAVRSVEGENGKSCDLVQSAVGEVGTCVGVYGSGDVCEGESSTIGDGSGAAAATDGVEGNAQLEAVMAGHRADLVCSAGVEHDGKVPSGEHDGKLPSGEHDGCMVVSGKTFKSAEGRKVVTKGGGCPSPSSASETVPLSWKKTLSLEAEGDSSKQSMKIIKVIASDELAQMRQLKLGTVGNILKSSLSEQTIQVSEVGPSGNVFHVEPTVVKLSHLPLTGRPGVCSRGSIVTSSVKLGSSELSRRQVTKKADTKTANVPHLGGSGKPAKKFRFPLRRGGELDNPCPKAAAAGKRSQRAEDPWPPSALPLLKQPSEGGPFMKEQGDTGDVPLEVETEGALPLGASGGEKNCPKGLGPITADIPLEITADVPLEVMQSGSGVGGPELSVALEVNPVVLHDGDDSPKTLLLTAPKEKSSTTPALAILLRPMKQEIEEEGDNPLSEVNYQVASTSSLQTLSLKVKEEAASLCPGSLREAESEAFCDRLRLRAKRAMIGCIKKTMSELERLHGEAKAGGESLASEEDGEPYACAECGLSSYSKTEMDCHVKVAHSLRRDFYCTACDRCFTKRHLFRLHMEMHDAVRPQQDVAEDAARKVLRCDTCGLEFSGKQALHLHEATKHTGAELHSCSLCTRKFLSAEKRDTHQSLCSGNRIECEVCHKEYNVASLMQHMRTHRGEKPYLCAECGKMFSQKGDLKRHTRQIHQGLEPHKPFLCSFCPKTFSAQSKLSVHERSHTKEKPFTCHECGRGFAHMSTLRKHQENREMACLPVLRQASKPFTCSICKKGWDQKYALTKHIAWVHERKRPGRTFPCTRCSKVYYCRSQLVYHERTHTKERPFACEICDKSFMYNSVRKIHMAKEHGQKE